jgi:Cof subfamily protein (haloacid dehalogenase superfamily)
LISYKIIASDLDGTLLNSRSEISPENLDAIAKLHEKGIQFVPCSGRTFSEIPVQIRENPAIRYVIHSNGAAVLDKITGQRILNCIPNSTVRKIMDLLMQYESHICIRHNSQCFVDDIHQSEEWMDYYNVAEAQKDCVRKYALRLDRFTDYVYGADQVEVFSAFFRNYEDKVTCKKILMEDPSLHVAEISEHNIEIMNARAGKGNALYALADLLNINRAETISIGDSDNDRSITLAAGLGLAVSNACDALKNIADQVICSNEDHVAQYVLEHYFK